MKPETKVKLKDLKYHPVGNDSKEPIRELLWEIMIVFVCFILLIIAVALKEWIDKSEWFPFAILVFFSFTLWALRRIIKKNL